ncbi:hypothetical protein IFR05_016910, partial [Cadophora sp. M221]
MSLPRGCRSAESASLNTTSSPTSLRIYAISTAHQLPRTFPPAIREPSGRMRLLQSDGDGNLSLTEFFEDDIPEYAILSHRWGAEEVTFRDLIDGTNKVKAGYGKIQFCGEQARRDGLQYFWVDTCCIDKSSSTELAEAINSMFSWYQNAARCYVYLSDVLIRKRKESDTSAECTWESAFRASKWFTRGWTLQELLAPRSVEFFSWEGNRIGDKRTFEEQIHEITGIPATALREYPLSQFDVHERFSWAKSRQTTRGEDKAYSLFGIFDVQMPLLYGEGEVKAFQRLREAIDKPLKDSKKDLLLHLPYATEAPFNSYIRQQESTCHPDTRVGLLQEIYDWCDGHDKRCIFWLNGLAGTGKSTIARTIARRYSEQGHLGASFFFSRGVQDPLIVNHDIFLFLEYNPGIIGQEWNLGANWPGEEVLRQLVLYASGLFIWASTTCRFIREGRRFARNRLDTILKGSSSASTAPEKHLDEIYLAVLKHSISSDYSDEEKEEACDMLKHMLGSTVVLLSPLSTSALSRLLQGSRDEVDSTFNDLHAILNIPNNPTRELRLHHPSFRDFLLSKDRCGNFWVDEKQAHQILAARCIQLMSQTLKKDICEMHAPGSQASQVESNRVQKYLPPEVQYACLYWVQHLQRSSFQVHDSEKAYVFLQTHLLHWLEALGWMGKTLEGIQAILSLKAHVSATKSPGWHAFIYDSKRFVLYNRLAIEQAPLQLYCSALVFTPRNSIVRRNFEGSIPDWIQLSPKVQAHWSAALQTLEGHTGSVSSVAFSPDDKQVVSGSHDGTIRLWDAATGEPLQTLEGHTGSVFSVAFSPDGKQVVSSSYDKTVRLWDTATGAPLQTLEGHTDWVYSAAFSPDGKQVVSGSGDEMVRLWDAATRAPLQTLEGHTDSAFSVAFSPDGKQVVSGSGDGTVRLWDAVTGAPLQMLEGHTSSVYSVAFSLNGKQVVSGSGDETVRLWDAVTRAPLQMLEGHTSSVYSVAFSLNGKQIVSGSHDRTVRLWDAATGALLQTLEGHTGSAYSVAFSPDGKLFPVLQ